MNYILFNYKYIFSEYGVKLAKDDLFANILPNMLELTDYEEQYMTPKERKNRGFQVKVAKDRSNYCVSSPAVQYNFLLGVKTLTKSPGIGIAKSIKSCNLH